MQPSPYLKVYPSREKPGHVLLFSTKNAAKIVLKQETFDAMHKGTLAPADETILAMVGMIVDDPQAERNVMLGLMDKLNAMSAGLSLMVLLNLDCNFACPYCYEGDMKGNHYMSDEVADRLIDFIKERFTDDKKSLIIDFYGGEPLLSTGLIKRISQELKSLTKARGGSYNFTLVTNGSLFSRQVA